MSSIKAALRSGARRISLAIEKFPQLHARLKDVFLRLGPGIRGEQMIFDHLDQLAKSGQAKTFCVIGANDGTTNDHLYPFAKRYQWKGILVEPVPTYFEELQKAYRGLPVMLENSAVHQTERSMTLHYLDHRKMDLPAWARGVGSFKKENIDALNEIPGHEKALTEVQVPCCRLEEIVERSGLGHIDIVAIDTEGYDAEIVHQVLLDEWKVGTLIFEHKLLPEKVLADCLELLSKHGFHFKQDQWDVLAVRDIASIKTKAPV